MSHLKINGFERELLATRLSNLIRGRRPSSAAEGEDRERGAERRAQLERIARRARGRS